MPKTDKDKSDKKDRGGYRRVCSRRVKLEPNEVRLLHQMAPARRAPRNAGEKVVQKMEREGRAI